MFRSVNINEPITRVRVMFLEPVEPKNARRNEIFRFGHRIVWPKGDARFENCSRRGGASDFFCDAKPAQRRFQAAFLSPDSKTRTGNRIRTKDFTITGQGETLIAKGNVDFRSGTLH